LIAGLAFVAQRPGGSGGNPFFKLLDLEAILLIFFARFHGGTSFRVRELATRTTNNADRLQGPDDCSSSPYRERLLRKPQNRHTRDIRRTFTGPTASTARAQKESASRTTLPSAGAARARYHQNSVRRKRRARSTRMAPTGRLSP